MRDNLGNRIEHLIGAFIASSFLFFGLIIAWILTFIFFGSLETENFIVNKSFWITLFSGVSALYLTIVVPLRSYEWFFESWYCVDRNMRGKVMSCSKRISKVNVQSLFYKFYKFSGKVLITLRA